MIQPEATVLILDFEITPVITFRFKETRAVRVVIYFPVITPYLLFQSKAIS
jgi:hypothetical protein